MLELNENGLCTCGCGQPYLCNKAITDDTTTTNTNNQPTVLKPEEDSKNEILGALATRGIRKLPRQAIELSSAFPKHEHQENKKEDLPPETFDVDSKIFLVWQKSDGNYILVDGHHHFETALTATHFVTSELQKGRLIACENELLCRVIAEEDGWSLDLVQKISAAANFKDKKALSVEVEEQTADSLVTDNLLGVNFSVYVDCLATDARNLTILSTDNKKNEMRVRQRASRVDCVNFNNRIYPRNVANKAVEMANEWAKQGLMTSELEHPAIVKDNSSGRSEDKFAHNPKRQTAVINRIFPADSDGWIDIERTIKGSTPCGKIVMDAIKSGNPLGISTRFHVKGKVKNINGQNILVADILDIVTFDDVRDPAVDGAGQPSPVTDSVLSFLTGDSETYSGLPNGQSVSPVNGPYLGAPYFGENNNTINPPNLSVEKDTDMEDESYDEEVALEDSKNMLDITRLIQDFKQNYSTTGANPISYATDGIKIVHEIKSVADSRQRKALLDSFKAAYDSSTMAGYRGGAISVTVASELGGEVGAGWGSEIETATGLGKLTLGKGMQNPKPHGENGIHWGAEPDAKVDARLQAFLDEKEEKDAKKEMKKSFEKACEDHEEMKHESEAVKDSIWKLAKKVARPGTDMKEFIDATLKHMTLVDSTASAKASTIPANGEIGKSLNTLSTDGEKQLVKGVSLKRENRPWAAGTDKFLKASDDMCRKMNGAVVGNMEIVNPDSTETIKRRAHNNKLMIPVLDDHAKRRMQFSRDNSEFALAMDSADDGMRLLQKSANMALGLNAATDTTTTTQVLNQPMVAEGLVVQAFQDLTALEFIMAMGPREFDSLTGGFSRNPYPIGTNLRIPSISYTPAAGWGYSDAFNDFGLATPENTGIAPGNVDISWLTYGLKPKRISTIITRDAIQAIGNGPGDISLLSWELYMMVAKESRTIDNLLYNEMVNAAYEFQAVAVSAESYTTGNNLLPNNSVYVAAGPVTVNLNPQKKANAAIALGSNNYPSDMSVTYPAVVPSGSQQIVSAVRLLAGGANANAAPFYGFYNGAGYPGTIGPGPVVRPRTTTTLSNAAGNTTNVTTNPVTVTGTLSTPVQGEVSSYGGIVSYPGTTATFAIDYENGTIVFASGAVTGSATLQTTSFAITYSYATNWVDFVSDYNLAQANSLVPATITQQVWHNNIMSYIDQTAAQMGTFSNYIKPDCYLGNLINSSYVTDAQIFAPLFSPPGTELYPSPSAYAERNGVMFHRHNSSWVGRSQTGLLTRKGSSFYAQDTPFEIQGPVTVQDASGFPTGNLAYYGIEFSAIGTRQPIDLNGNVLSCPNKVVISRLNKQGLGVF